MNTLIRGGKSIFGDDTSAVYDLIYKDLTDHWCMDRVKTIYKKY